jgi:hypothetical protein
MANPQVQHFLDRIAAAFVEQDTKAERDRWLEQDRKDLPVEIAEYLRAALDVPRLERELAARSRLDHDALVQVTSWFVDVAKADPTAFARTLPNGEPFDWEKRIEQLGILAENVENAKVFDELEIGLRLNMVGDSAYEKLLMSLPVDHDLRTKIDAALLPKLAYVNDAEALDYWDRLRSEVAPSRESGLKPEPDVAAADFFKPGTSADARERIAKYLTRVRPVLVRRAFDGGQRTVPAGQAGIAQILSWTKESTSTRALTTVERTIVRSIGRIAHYFGGDDQIAVAAALGVPVGGYFIGGRAEEEALRAFDLQGKIKPPDDGLRRELVKLLQIADVRAPTREGTLERALRGYKLGLEVMAQDDLVKVMRGHREERLQRELCRFLVERGIIAYGTKFGWSESDVLGHDELGAALIETKILKRLPSAGDVNRWLTQLATYMNQEQGPSASRGVLVLYNFTASSILTPPAPLVGRYDVIAVNLCPDPPSKRKASVEIAPATTGDDMVKVLRLGEPARAAKKKKSAPAGRTGPAKKTRARTKRR